MQFILTSDVLDGNPQLTPQANEGAIACFRGYVRDYNPYKNIFDVVAIEYSCYTQLAQKEGLRILQAAAEQYQLSQIICIHRIGRVNVKEASIHLEAASAHRTNVFEALKNIMDEIKKSVPIWKKEIKSSGESIWT